MSSSRRILGIDPGSYHLGVGCIEKQGNNLQLVRAEIIHPPKKDAFFDRLDVLSARLRRMIEELQPTEVAVEDIFHAKNVRSAIHLGVARGVAIAACLERGIKIFEYPPTQVKMVVTGYGRADKEQVAKMVKLTLGVEINDGYDATDAIAVAICHAHAARPLSYV